MIFLIVDLRQYCVCCIRLGVIRSTLLINGVQPGPYVPVSVTPGATVAHRYTYAPPRCRTSQYLRTFISVSVSLWNDLTDPVFDGVGLVIFKSRPCFFVIGRSCLIPTIVFYFFLLFLPIGWYCGAGVFGLIGCISLSLGHALPTSFNNNNNMLIFYRFDL